MSNPTQPGSPKGGGMPRVPVHPIQTPGGGTVKGPPSIIPRIPVHPIQMPGQKPAPVKSPKPPTPRAPTPRKIVTNKAGAYRPTPTSSAKPPARTMRPV